MRKMEKKSPNVFGPNGLIFKFTFSESSQQIRQLGLSRILGNFCSGKIGFTEVQASYGHIYGQFQGKVYLGSLTISVTNFFGKTLLRAFYFLLPKFIPQVDKGLMCGSENAVNHCPVAEIHLNFLCCLLDEIIRNKKRFE